MSVSIINMKVAYGLSIGTDVGGFQWVERCNSPYFAFFALFHRIR